MRVMLPRILCRQGMYIAIYDNEMLASCFLLCFLTHRARLATEASATACSYWCSEKNSSFVQ